MHKGVIVLSKTSTRSKALETTREFLKSYGDGDVWDWYQIGGRWTQTLCPQHNDFIKWAENKFDLKYMSGVEKHRNELQKEWEKQGLKGENPFCNHYNLPEDGNYYDVMQLKDCIDVVNEWSQDYVEVGKKELEDAKKWLKGGERSHNENNWNMYGFCVKRAAHFFQQDFCFDCNVYNIDAKYNEEYSIPEKLKGWSAVMIDMHN